MLWQSAELAATAPVFPLYYTNQQSATLQWKMDESIDKQDEHCLKLGLEP
jgi:hypothetical protein